MKEKSEIIHKVSRILTPSVPSALIPQAEDSASGTREGETFSDQNQLKIHTTELYALLLDRIELRLDLARHGVRKNADIAGIGEELEAVTAPQTLEKRLKLIREGNLRDAIADITKPEDTKHRTIENDLRQLRESEQRISDLLKYPGVLEQYGKFREKRLQSLKKVKEVIDGLRAQSMLRLQQQKMARQVFLENRKYSPGEQRIIEDNGKLISAIDMYIEDIQREHPEAAGFVRLKYLQDLQKGLKTDRFAETPSRRRCIDAIREYWSQGKKVLLTGPTGGGKTELLFHAARSLFGVEPEHLTGHELLTNYEIYGKTKGGTKDGQITLMFGAAPFVRALQRNVPFIFDEINVVPNKILMRTKTDLNATVGQTITVQEDGDEKVVVGDRFAVGAAANVKNEKHIDREKLDPALVRMFEPLPVDYIPPEELYDDMLASMMDVKSGIRLSVSGATKTLRALCDATEWVQKSYLGEKVYTDGVKKKFIPARGQAGVGKTATLREAVLDSGKALGMLSGWEDAQKEGLSIREFLNKKITAFINNDNFPEDDRYYLVEIFALQGFLKGIKVSELRVAGLSQSTLDSWNGYKEGEKYELEHGYISAEEVATLDPYNIRRGVSVSALVGDLLDEEGMGKVITGEGGAESGRTRLTQEKLADVTRKFIDILSNMPGGPNDRILDGNLGRKVYEAFGQYLPDGFNIVSLVVPTKKEYDIMDDVTRRQLGIENAMKINEDLRENVTKLLLAMVRHGDSTVGKIREKSIIELKTRGASISGVSFIKACFTPTN